MRTRSYSLADTIWAIEPQSAYHYFASRAEERLTLAPEQEKVVPSIISAGTYRIDVESVFFRYGSLMLADAIRQTAQEGNAVLLSVNSPGGQTAGTDAITQAIAEARQSVPVIGYINNGMAASAGYKILAGCTRIYASSASDMVGSIGMMLSWQDFSKILEEIGIKIHEVYADQSTLKNIGFRNAKQKGDYKELKENLLNPNAQLFIDHVKAHRNISDEDAFAGKLYTAAQAEEIGIIDGIRTYSQLISEIKNMATENHEVQEAKSFLAHIKGFFNRSQDSDTGTSEVLEAVPNDLAMKALELKDQLFEAQNALEKLQAENQALKAQLKAAQEEVERLGNLPAAEPTAVDSATTGEIQTQLSAQEEAWKKIDSLPHNRRADEYGFGPKTQTKTQ